MKCPLCNNFTNQKIAKELRSGERRSVFYCKKCDFGILDRDVSGQELKNYYQKNYRKASSHKLNSGASPKELFEGAVMFQNDRLSILRKHFGKNKKLLEVGCSSGMFLWHARNFVKEAVGLDYDSNSSKYAAKKCNCATYDIDIEKTGLKEDSFDIICAFQTVEHVGDPVGFISRYKKYLKPGGIMAIEVPNLRDALLYVYDIPAHEKFYFHAAHLWYFTPQSLGLLMDKNGFEGEVMGLQDYNILNHMQWIINGAPQKTSLSGLAEPTLPIRNSAGASIKKSLNDFIIKTDLEYKKKLAELEVASNIFYIGKIKK